MTSNRLLAACTWFEEIPTTKSLSTIATEDVDAISRAANATALAHGHTQLESRIRGALKWLSTETHQDQFIRLVNSVTEKFGKGVFRDGVISDLRAAINLRGKAAHGHLSTDDDAAYLSLARATYAMEALCFLLTIRDLPIDEQGIERAGRSPFLQNYRLCH
jgi:hypothetical protein